MLSQLLALPTLSPDFECMENWDLQAVVRGCMEYSQEDVVHPFPQLLEATTAFDELDELYKPFYPVLHTTSPPTILTSNMSVPQEGITTEATKKLKNMKESANICKKSRKNKNKRVVKEVKAEDLSDVWAWRKYGQKPIKGSPYPRSYYRCSSSKECSVRKQVERSCSNPETFIITYAHAEHNHGHPARRNSLAGSTRTKLPSSKNKSNNSVNSPTMANLMTSINEGDYELVQLVQSTSITKKLEAKLLEEDEVSHESVMLDKISSDEISPSSEDLDRKLKELDELLITSEPIMDGWFLDQFSDNVESSWFIGHSNSSVTGDC